MLKKINDKIFIETNNISSVNIKEKTLAFFDRKKLEELDDLITFHIENRDYSFSSLKRIQEKFSIFQDLEEFEDISRGYVNSRFSFNSESSITTYTRSLYNKIKRNLNACLLTEHKKIPIGYVDSDFHYFDFIIYKETFFIIELRLAGGEVYEIPSKFISEEEAENYILKELTEIKK